MTTNLIQGAGDRDIFYLQNFNPEDRTWSRQTVYFTNKGFPILMTAQRKFFAKNPQTGRRDYKPVAHIFIKNSKPSPITKRTPLPRKLRQYREEPFDKKVDYMNTNKANLYSIKRLTVKKLREKKIATALTAMSALPQNIQRDILTKVRKKAPEPARPVSVPSPNYTRRSATSRRFVSTRVSPTRAKSMNRADVQRHEKYRSQIKKVAKGDTAGILKRFNTRLKQASGSA